jgi:hypothetical protein
MVADNQRGEHQGAVKGNRISTRPLFSIAIRVLVMATTV